VEAVSTKSDVLLAKSLRATRVILTTRQRLIPILLCPRPAGSFEAVSTKSDVLLAKSLRATRVVLTTRQRLTPILWCPSRILLRWSARVCPQPAEFFFDFSPVIWIPWVAIAPRTKAVSVLSATFFFSRDSPLDSASRDSACTVEFCFFLGSHLTKVVVPPGGQAAANPQVW
jgi:hypothetical protein